MSTNESPDPPTDAAGQEPLGRASRILQLAAALRGATEPETAEALAGALGVSVRTVYRDIDTLRAHAYAIDGAPGRGYRLISEPTGATSAPPAPAALEAPPPSALLPRRLPAPSPLRAAIRARSRADEEQLIAELAGEARSEPETEAAILERAQRLIAHMRDNRRNEGGIDRFMHQYALSSEEGVALMCLAEALLRIPDAATADALIEDKIGGAKWEKHLGKADSLFVNASTIGLLVSGRVLRLGSEETTAKGLSAALGRLVHRSGEPVIRTAVRQAMRIMGRQFVMGRTIGEALDRLKSEKGGRASFDMLGEAARTEADAARYHQAYLGAIAAVGKAEASKGPVAAHGVSIKLSALHPRYEFAKSGRDREQLYERLLEAAEAAAAANIGLCVDAEEEERLEPSLDLIARLAHEPSLVGWDGLGLAVQAYQRRARPLVDWVIDLARTSGRRLSPRLVKGAYWDTEIKRAQVLGYPDFPVFTRKAHTDVSYLACAKAMFAAGGALHPCFATHNAQTVAALIALAGGRDPNGSESWEFQRLHGMGAPLYDGLAEQLDAPPPVRIYAPVGGHADLLAYLVRRLLENGANSSFVNRIVDDAAPIDELAESPVETAARAGFQRHPQIAAPAELFAPRKNSAGCDLFAPDVVGALADEVSALEKDAPPIVAEPMLAIRGGGGRGAARDIRNPAKLEMRVGQAYDARPDDLDAAMETAAAAQPGWDARGAEARAAILERAADLYERHGVELMRLAVREAGKSWPDAVAELREAVDFLRYYAAEARRLFDGPHVLPGPTGEENTLRLAGSGAWVCISPWNFPLAIFTGQIAAALAAGNAVIAKPAEQTPLIAAKAVALLHEAGVDAAALQYAPGDGATIGRVLLDHPALGGVAFTGSTETARIIQRQLAARDGRIIPLIAETGGINAMIVDSSALPEQVTRDVLISAFQSAGQRCSALRVLYLQDECWDRQIEMIAGAMQALRLGDPAQLATDVGPVIDRDAEATLAAHIEALRSEGRILAETPKPADGLGRGHWIAPVMARIDGIEALEREMFGPVLHVARWKATELDGLIDRINAAGYGLTLGLHSRVTATRRRIAARARVGNLYVNRNQIGAIVGSQPFGGEGLSGTGPKAGGPHTLLRFAVERSVSVDLTAEGGDARLMTMEA